MTKEHWGITLLLGLMMSGLPLVAQSKIEREIKDRAEIEKLMWQYARAFKPGKRLTSLAFELSYGRSGT